jgi:hypothetical protein
MNTPAPALLVFVLVVGGALVAGSVVARQADHGLSSAERLVNAFLLGTGLLGLTIFLVGLIRLDRVSIAVILSAAYLPLLYRQVRSWLYGNLRSLVRGFTPLMIAHITVLGLLFVAAAARPTGDIGNDAISYHLLGPTVWLRTGKIVPVLDSALTAFPVLIESLFSAGIGLSDDRFPGMLGVAFAGFFLVQVYAFCRGLGATKQNGVVMSFLVACAPAIMSRASTAYVDIAYASFSLAAVRSLLLSEFRSRQAAIGGLFLGFALGVKYTALPLVAITLLALFLAHAQSVSPMKLLRRAALTLTIAVVVGAPFYIKNAILLGSPIYPPPVYLAHLFHARAFPIEASERLQRIMVQTFDGFGRGAIDGLLLPWRYTLFTDRYEGFGGIGTAPLALGVIGAMVTRPRRWVSVLLVWMSLIVLVWFFTVQQSRFLIHVEGLSFAFAALGAMWLEREWPRVGRVAVALVVFTSATYGLRVMFSIYRAPLIAAISTAAERNLRQRSVPYLEAWEYLNRRSDVRRVLILDPVAPAYYLTKDYVKIRGSLGERPIEGIGNTQQALERLGELRVTHILDVVPPSWSLQPSFLDPLPEPGFKVSSSSHLRLVFESDSARVYEVIHDSGLP